MPCKSDLAATAALKAMVTNLAQAFEKEKVDFSAFHPHTFATLAVYHASFLQRGNHLSHNGLARWCFGIRPYVRGAEIEGATGEQRPLASQCMPQHYAAGGELQPAGAMAPQRTIAPAPVTCELCHVGLAGHDALVGHCATHHCGLAEYRKRVFTNPVTRGCPLCCRR